MTRNLEGNNLGLNRENRDILISFQKLSIVVCSCDENEPAIVILTSLRYLLVRCSNVCITFPC